MTKEIEQTWSLFLARSFHASREDVFNCFSSVEQMQQWFGPSQCRVIDGEMDFREGGKYKLNLQTEKGHVALEGVFQEIKAPEKLVYTWQWTENEMFDSIESLVSFEFVEDKGETTIHMNHTGLENEDSQANHHHGWSGSYDKLFMYAIHRFKGRIGWNEIATQDASKTKSFYTELLGWNTIDFPMGDFTYTCFQSGGKEVAGMIELPPEAADSPTRWVNYINVEDIQQSIAKAKELGATVVVDLKTIEGKGSMAVLTDTMGAEFALWEFADCSTC